AEAWSGRAAVGHDGKSPGQLAGAVAGHDPPCTAGYRKGGAMNAKTVAKNYACLTPEERFRLILAAGGGGDDAARGPLPRGAGRADHAVHVRPRALRLRLYRASPADVHRIAGSGRPLYRRLRPVRRRP